MRSWGVFQACLRVCVLGFRVHCRPWIVQLLMIWYTLHFMYRLVYVFLDVKKVSFMFKAARNLTPDASQTLLGRFQSKRLGLGFKV